MKLRTDNRGHWPFLLGGIAVGVSESIYYVIQGRPINLVSAPGELAAFLEMHVGFPNTLYGRVFSVDLDPVFLGIVLGAAFVGFLQGGRRSWVRYPARVLACAFIGGVLFGVGANLAGGDFLYHTMAGVALLQIPSLFIVALSIPFLFISLEIMSVFNITPFFQLDQGLPDICKEVNAGRRGQRGHRYTFSYMFYGVILVLIAGLVALNISGNNFSPDGLALGAILGIATAVTGFGVEWGMLVPEMSTFSTRYLEQLGIGAKTSSLLQNIALLQAWFLAVAILSLTALATWVAHGITETLPTGISGNSLNIGHVAGGPLLAVGSVLMLGSDLRSYSRLGLGYETAFFAFPGLLLGYLPTALWHDEISAWLDSSVITNEVWLPRLISDAHFASLAIWAILLTGLMVFLFLSRTTKKPAP